MNKDLNNLVPMEEMREEMNNTLKKFQDATVVSVAQNFKWLANKIITDTEGVDNLKPSDVLERIVVYADKLISERTKS